VRPKPPHRRINNSGMGQVDLPNAIEMRGDSMRKNRRKPIT
jgi:hypothetical protein